MYAIRQRLKKNIYNESRKITRKLLECFGIQKNMRFNKNHVVQWQDLTEEERRAFTMEGTIEKRDWLCNNKRSSHEYRFYKKKEIDCFIEQASERKTLYYGETDTFLYNCLLEYPVRDKKVAILGSQSPWYESICLSQGGIPTTIEYNTLKTNDPRLTLLTVEEYQKNPVKFDAAFSISSFEHDGLGRYGDPIDPDGDLKAMQYVREHVLHKGGILYLSVPIGKDTIYWNAHRVYGIKRWVKLIEGFEEVCASGFTKESLQGDAEACYQPVIVLRSK